MFLYCKQLLINNAKLGSLTLSLGIYVACVAIFVASPVHFSDLQLQLLSQQAIMQSIY